MKKNERTQILLASTIVIAAALVCFPFREAIGYRSVALILLLVVSSLAMRLNLSAVVTAATLSALIWDYFFIPPQFTFHVDSAEDALFLAMYFIVAVLNGIINYRLRQLERLKREKIERESALKLYNTLFSSLSHDLRTPISVILASADTLTDSTVQLTEIQRIKLIEEITSGAIRMNDQVENLLNMSRIEAGLVHPIKNWCDLSDLIHSTLKKNPYYQLNHKIEVTLPPQMPLVQLDYGLMRQVIENLLSNTVRHTPAGSVLKISAQIENANFGHFEEAPNGEDFKNVHDAVSHKLILKFTDNGPGFKHEELDKVFDKFYRPKETKADGTGLGLYVVRGFVEAHGGEITLVNILTGGSSFQIEIPTAIVTI
jgi:two-component system, OmpR family, sensor histidine kinase KdpD